MTKRELNELIDQLLARDGDYRPSSLLLLLRRIDRASLARIESDPEAVLEDLIFGDPARVLAQLNWAAERARALGLEPRTEPRRAGQGRFFRRATADHQMRTIWCRAPAAAQADLFFDNSLAVARRELVRALQQADRQAAEAALLDLSRTGASTDLLTDAEHLVGALSWLAEPALDQGSAVAALEGDLALRAKRVLGRADGEGFIARAFRQLARQVPASGTVASDVDRAELFLRGGEPAAALAAIDERIDDRWNPGRQLVELRASLALDQRERALDALSRLCWTDAHAAEAWLERGEDEELSRRVEQFWDLEEALAISLFPAWLLARGYPMPPVDGPPDCDAATALASVRTLRQAPSDMQARSWLQEHCPDLMADWMKERA